MAPKRGGGSSSGGGSSGGGGGDGSASPLRRVVLIGNNWKNPITDTQFALTCLAVLALVYCLIKAARTTRVRYNGAPDKWRNSGYKWSCCFSLLSYGIDIATTVLREQVTTVPVMFYVIYAIQSALIVFSTILLFAVIFRAIHEGYRDATLQNPTMVRYINHTLTILFTITSCFYLGFYCKYIAEIISDDLNYSNSVNGSYADMARKAIAVTMALDTLGFGIWFSIKKLSPTSHRGSLLTIAVFLLLGWLVALVSGGLSYTYFWNSGNYNLSAEVNSRTASAIVSPVCDIIVYVTLVHLAQTSISNSKVVTIAKEDIPFIDDGKYGHTPTSTQQDLNNTQTQYHSGYGRVSQHDPPFMMQNPNQQHPAYSGANYYNANQPMYGQPVTGHKVPSSQVYYSPLNRGPYSGH